ncbi:hypothetical protein [Flavobacterium sp. CF136]|uniref:hypothetical protein n=1 Tax=Flavobacterium sp. (strain CF136) TaxID=1144313 RepID=UPI0002717C14|nr:hypothetical protein [Flavobacterium sp. CF136]EJL66911.1 hypothetical protein PMI10_00491 [Flavobacterium sp. CF136]
MRNIFLLVYFLVFISCNKTINKEKSIKSKEDLILEFCKSDIAISSISPSTIKYDSVLTIIFSVEKSYPYYKKELDDAYGFKQINDSISKKWNVSLTFDSQNNYGANIRNNITYILKENDQYIKDTLFNDRFVILSKRDQNKMHEYMGIK